MIAQTFDANGLPANEAPQQSRAEWLESRKLQIGASDVAAILGMSPWASAWEVFAEKTNRLEPWKGDKSTRAGQDFEASVLDVAERELGTLERNVRIVHPSLPMAATLDGRVLQGGNPVEAKTTGIVGPVYGEWGEALTDQVPDYYLVQVHAQLLVTGAELAYLYALIAGRGVVPYQIERDEKLCDLLADRCSKWWEYHVVRDIAPEFTEPCMEVVKRLRRQSGKHISLGPDVAELCSELEAAKAAKKLAEERVDTLQARVVLALDGAESADFPDGSSITYRETERKGYVVNDSKFRTLRFKKGKS